MVIDDRRWPLGQANYDRRLVFHAEGAGRGCPPLVTFHVWIWYPNPNGVFGEYNPLLTPFNKE